MTTQNASNHPDYPEEYITGKVMFFGREFQVTPDVLIPRLETECLVRRARNCIDTQDFDVIVDVGTGSGIIITSIANKTRNCELFALDISSHALHIAKRNFHHHHAHHRQHNLCHFLEMNLLEGLGEYLWEKKHTILFLANLPYIKWWDWENMSPDTRFEPELALFWWEKTGFELYEMLFAQIVQLSFWSTTILIEFGFDQRIIAEQVIQSYGWKYEFFPDYAWIERFCEINLTNSKTE